MISKRRDSRFSNETNDYFRQRERGGIRREGYKEREDKEREG